MDPTPSHGRLYCLPIELLEMIVSFIPENASLKALSRVTKLFRQLCAPKLFQSLQVGFSIPKLDRLLEVSNSQLARYVKVIHYEAPALVDPQQQEILQADRDTRALVTSLPCFPNLHTLRLSFVDGIEDQFKWLANRILLDGHSMFPNHLERLLTAVAVARGREVIIRSFEICGFHSRAAAEDQFLQELAMEALQNVEELRLVDSPALLPFLNRVSFPRLGRVEIASCWLSVPPMEEFIQLHADSLRFLHLRNTWVLVEELNNEGIHLSVGSPKTVLNHLASLLSTGSIMLTMD
ncbi:hypothetical protein BDW72DRAFT_209026 [Aspergillus terricola var. indicus]